jgi:hypothetical protein
MRENEITQAVIGAAIEMHRILGPGMIERPYEDAMCREFHLLDESEGISTQRRGGEMRGTQRKL